VTRVLTSTVFRSLGAGAPFLRGAGALLGGLLLASAVPGLVAAAHAQEKWVRIFDGKTLAGWEGRTDVFRVEDGAIVAGSLTAPMPRNEFLCSLAEYGDFVLRLEFHMPGDKMNAGVQFRSQRIPDDHEVIGYQADMGDGWWGALYDESRRNTLLAKPDDAVIARALVKDGWNQYAIYARERHVRLFINGHLTVDYTEPDTTLEQRGRICLQIHSGPPGEVRYRHIEIREFVPRPQIAASPSDAVRFRTHVVTHDFIAEGIAVGDVNRDGRPDLVAGAYWFEGPSWTPHAFREPRRFAVHTEYSDAFLSFAFDVDGDGWVDIVQVGAPGREAVWYANPGGTGGHWTRRPVHPAVASESPRAEDVNGTGRPDLLFLDRDASQKVWLEPPSGTRDGNWTRHAISAAMPGPRVGRLAHGLGFDDVDGDGRKDVIAIDAWWRAPERAGDPWVEHPAALGEPAAQMFAYDIDGDGDADVVSSSAHDYGIWWHEQVREPGGRVSWKTHTIDDRVSQTHALAVADLNGDGIPDLVTGKRFFAHNGNDPGAFEPSVLLWYQGGRDANGRPTWTPRLVHGDAGVGLQVLVVDVTGDGRLDIVTASKKGVYVFERLP
jgi:hypothetical protein